MCGRTDTWVHICDTEKKQKRKCIHFGVRGLVSFAQHVSGSEESINQPYPLKSFIFLLLVCLLLLFLDLRDSYERDFEMKTLTSNH